MVALAKDSIVTCRGTVNVLDVPVLFVNGASLNDLHAACRFAQMARS